MQNQSTTRSQHEQDLVRIANFRLMDDDFLSEILDNDIEAVTLILQIILQRNDLNIISAKTQYEYHSAGKRSLRLDVLAIDTLGVVYDIELQRKDEGASPKRLRYHSSRIDSDLLHKGDAFDDLNESYVIFICENDIFRQGCPIYHVNRHIEEMNYALYNDGSHLIYVNGQYRNLNDPIGQLMHDFNSRRSEDMVLPVLAKRVHDFKETSKGVETMSEMLEQMRKEVADNERLSFARRMIAEEFPLDAIARCTELPLSVIEALYNEMKIHA